MINNETDFGVIETNRATGVDEMNVVLLTSHRQAAINEINTEKIRINGLIDQFKNANDDEKKAITDKIGADVQTAIENINSNNQKNSIDQIVVDTIEEMNKDFDTLRTLEIKRSNALEVINSKYEEVKRKIEEEPLFTDEHRDAFNAAINILKENADEEIISASIDDIDTMLEYHLNEFNRASFAIYQQTMYDKMIPEEKLIEELSNITVTEKNDAIKANQDETISQGTIINYAGNEDEATTAKDNAIKYYNETYNNLKRINDDRTNALKEIDDYVYERIPYGEITDELQELIDEIKGNINQETETEKIEQEVIDGKNRIGEYIDNKINEVKKRVREELEEHAKKTISEEIEKIINDQVDKVNGNTYSNEPEIERIIEEGKYLIDNQELKEVKDKVREELEEYAKKPISDETQKIIDDQVDKVTKDNYKDQDEIDKIIEEGKKLIDDNELKETKDKVREELEEYAEKPISDETQKIIDDAVDKVTKDNYKNQDEINKIIDDTKKQIDEQKLKDNKNTIINELKEKYEEYINSGKYSEKGLQELSEIYENAVNQINEAKTLTEAENSRDKAIEDFAKVKQNSSNLIYIITLSIMTLIIFILLIVIKIKKRSNKKLMRSTTLPIVILLSVGVYKALIILAAIIIMILLVRIIYLNVVAKELKEKK
ncbi:DUF1542 domain-containing protein [Haploplasma axanthum]|uniref:DUF1542 domain-containing protein n=1 Tax=Haploplasma axanthum TaxID=29552 RepID=A0A449BF88_HAPAX|nr:DUF1542 domain-containing protein [Haploplasma axanthum]VEU81085.1 Uncharacterised protein [Haploplasma axanthum]